MGQQVGKGWTATQAPFRSCTDVCASEYETVGPCQVGPMNRLNTPLKMAQFYIEVLLGVPYEVFEEYEYEAGKVLDYVNETDFQGAPAIMWTYVGELF